MWVLVALAIGVSAPLVAQVRLRSSVELAGTIDLSFAAEIMVAIGTMALATVTYLSNLQTRRFQAASVRPVLVPGAASDAGPDVFEVPALSHGAVLFIENAGVGPAQEVTLDIEAPVTDPANVVPGTPATQPHLPDLKHGGSFRGSTGRSSFLEDERDGSSTLLLLEQSLQKSRIPPSLPIIRRCESDCCATIAPRRALRVDPRSIPGPRRRWVGTCLQCGNSWSEPLERMTKLAAMRPLGIVRPPRVARVKFGSPFVRRPLTTSHSGAVSSRS